MHRHHHAGGPTHGHDVGADHYRKLMRDERDEDGDPVHGMEDIAATLGVSSASVYRALQRSSNETSPAD